jgi:acyl-CoA synthetase (AMP-forming)/AMP-acid ligase II
VLQSSLKKRHNRPTFFTAGKPKGAMMTHGNLTSNAGTLVDFWRITDKDTLLHMLPIYHTHGLFVALHTGLLSGASIFFHPRFSVETVMKWLPQTTVFMGVPTYYRYDLCIFLCCTDWSQFVNNQQPFRFTFPT